MQEIEVCIADIKIPQHRARAYSDARADQLAQSISREGLLHRITVRFYTGEGDWTYTLVAGLHRLRAHEKLGCETIRANLQNFDENEDDLIEDDDGEMHSVSDLKALAVEIDENYARHDLTAQERMLHSWQRHEIDRLLGLAVSGRRGGRPSSSAKNPADSAGLRTNAQRAQEAGMSERTERDERHIVENQTPVLRAKLAASRIADNKEELRRLSKLTPLDQIARFCLIEGGEVGDVRSAGRELQRKCLGEMTEEYKAPALERVYKTVVIDPPWAPEITGDVDPFGKIAPLYPTMTLDEIKGLDVPDLAHPRGCHLYLWVTNRVLLSGAVESVLEAWGFRPITLLTWVKDRIGTGHYFMNQTEHAVFAVKGNMPIRKQGIPTFFGGKGGQHSAKPDEFYEVVEQASYGAYVDIFARNPRSGWDVRGSELTSPGGVARENAS